MTPGYSRLQLISAKILLVILVSAAAGPFLAKVSGQRLTMIAGLCFVLAILVSAYEASAHGIALVFGRLSPPVASDPRGPISVKRVVRIPLDPWDAGKALGWFIGAQIVIWILAATFAVMTAPSPANSARMNAMLADLLPVALPASLAASALALTVVLRQWRDSLGPVAFNWVLVPTLGTARQLLVGIASGAVLGSVYLATTKLVSYHDTGPPSLVSQAAGTPGPGRWAWLVAVVLLAPPLEEALFRGALLGALRESWGLWWAAIVCGVLFWLLHAPEWIRYWPAAVSIGVLTLVVTLLRVRTRSLGPSVAAHFAYNSVLAVALLSS